ncbi:hypothetical protein ACFPA8_24540 [Streptomyces ovatisporus]|uniref:Secreted protein n=1 Tax=Streptomyces ovatisporus TaxID=1128682 RepID=A0ABV9AE35_9ACTN
MTAVMPVGTLGLLPGGGERGAAWRVPVTASERPLPHGTGVLVDQHSHGVLQGDLGLCTFEAHLAAATGGKTVPSNCTSVSPDSSTDS